MCTSFESDATVLIMTWQVSCPWTSKATCTSIFREVFVEDDSAKVKPEYSRFLETIHEGGD